MDTERMTLGERDGAPDDPRDPLATTAYRTLATIGSGGAGLVLEAEHKRLRKRVCVKILREPSADFIDRMSLEAKSLAALDGHPNIVLATDFGETPGGLPFLVMERLVGRTLMDEIKRRGALPPLEAIEMTRQILSGLSAVHALGVVHRDIKPANLFLVDAREPSDSTSNRILKILDFGAAKLIRKGSSEAEPAPSVEPRAMETAEGLIIGSARYMAPEQISSPASVDLRTDLYAVGAVLYTLLTGRGPFDDRKGHAALMLGHLHATPAAPSTIAPYPLPALLDRAVLRALAKDPNERFADAEAFSGALGDAIAALPRERCDSPHPNAPELAEVPAWGGDPDGSPGGAGRRVPPRDGQRQGQTTSPLANAPATTDPLAPADTEPLADRTMVSRSYVLEGRTGQRGWFQNTLPAELKRRVLWVLAGGIVAGLLIGLVVLGVLR